MTSCANIFLFRSQSSSASARDFSLFSLVSSRTKLMILLEKSDMLVIDGAKVISMCIISQKNLNPLIGQQLGVGRVPRILACPSWLGTYPTLGGIVPSATWLCAPTHFIYNTLSQNFGWDRKDIQAKKHKLIF